MISCVRPAVAGDVGAIAERVRPADVAELWASNRTTAADCMAFGMRYSDMAMTGVFDGAPVCMFGAVPASLLGMIGVPWMVGTTALDRLAVQKALLRESRGAVSEMLTRYDVLKNVVDDRNKAAQRWLRWLGFTVDADVTPYGPDRLPFRGFEIRRIGNV